jgi:hypothetical protein
VECDSSQGFYEENFFRLKYEPQTKTTFFHFKQGKLELINFDLVQHNNLDLQKTIIYESITTKSTTRNYTYY